MMMHKLWCEMLRPFMKRSEIRLQQAISDKKQMLIVAVDSRILWRMTLFGSSTLPSLGAFPRLYLQQGNGKNNLTMQDCLSGQPQFL